MFSKITFSMNSSHQPFAGFDGIVGRCIQGIRVLLLWVWVCSPLQVAATEFGSASSNSSQVDFEEQIQPLLAKHCLACHGVDEAEGGLQFHSRETSLAVADSGQRAIVPGHASQSEMINRVMSDVDDLKMPPDGDRLTPQEVQTLVDWISQGANWKSHWAYDSLRVESPPTVNDTDWPLEEMDRFVLKRLEEQNVLPSSRADKSTLIKRLYYDLIGLPPTPQEVASFVDDSSANSYRSLVERLLDSEHFGERWGRHWLDMARYADSDGYEKDNHRPDAWRYRDWVIQAINSDMPFDQFTIEQIAGDLLSEANAQQRLATAFHRQTLTNTEGGTDREQWRVAAVMDRIETIGSVWLGLSVGCARCHSHKYDQITHQEYYQLYAYLNNADEVNAEIPKSEDAYQQIQEKIDSLEQMLMTRRGELKEAIDDWLPVRKREALAEEALKTEYHDLLDVDVRGPEGVTFVRQEDGSYLVGGSNPEVAVYTIEAKVDVAKITGLHLEVLPHESLSSSGPGRTSHGNFVLNEIRLFASPVREWKPEHLLPFGRAIADFSQDGWAVEGAIDGVEGAGKEGTGWAISPKFDSPHHASFMLKEHLADDLVHLKIELNHTYGSQHTIGCFRLKAITGKIAELGMPGEIREILVNDQRDDRSMNRLVDYQLSLDANSVDQQRELQKLREKLKAETMSVRVVGERLTDRRQTHVLRRGEFKQPQELVHAGGLSTLPEIASRRGEVTTDRLDFAQWLVSGQNPIVPRVTVNHIWSHLFGAGIVPTMNDFGVRGDRPTHPALLDHLASKFTAEGWSRKKLIEYIVCSATYQQSSRHRPELVDLDPNNRLLHRQNRFRVEAEIVRDIALAASGLLSPKIGGASVFPPIPDSVTDLTYNSSFKWNTSNGEDRYRRGLYTYFKRTAPHPNLITFDCPDSNVSNVQRDRSNTPIAALVTLNNETFVEAAQAMARRVLTEQVNHSDRDRLAYALQLCISRLPSSEEVDEFQQLLAVSRKWYQQHEDDALLMVGSQAAQGVQAAENAAWIATVRMMLNLDEFITRE